MSARLPSRNPRLRLMAVACSINLLFGTFFLANSLGIPYYHFYILQSVNIVVLSPFIDWAVWFASAILVASEMLARVLMDRRGRIPLWAIVPCLLLPASFALFSFNSQAGVVLSAILGYGVVGLSVHCGKGTIFARRRDALALILSGSGAILIAIELASLASWLINPFDY